MVAFVFTAKGVFLKLGSFSSTPADHTGNQKDWKRLSKKKNTEVTGREEEKESMVKKKKNKWINANDMTKVHLYLTVCIPVIFNLQATNITLKITVHSSASKQTCPNRKCFSEQLSLLHGHGKDRTEARKKFILAEKSKRQSLFVGCLLAPATC